MSDQAGQPPQRRAASRPAPRGRPAPQPRSHPARRPPPQPRRRPPPSPRPGGGPPREAGARERHAATDPMEQFRRQRLAQKQAEQEAARRAAEQAAAQRAAEQAAARRAAEQRAAQQAARQRKAQAETGRFNRRHQDHPAQGAGGSVDPFEAFRQQKQAKAAEEERLAEERQRSEQAAAETGWIEGIGPAASHVDPSKPSGFNRGRYETPKFDPNSLQRPAGFEDTRHAKPGETKVEVREEDRPSKFQRF